MKDKLVLLVLGCAVLISACAKNGISDSQSGENLSEIEESSGDNTAGDSTTEDNISYYGNAVEIDVDKLSEEDKKLFKDIYESRVAADEYVPNGVTVPEIIAVITGEGKFVNTDDSNKEIYLSELRREDKDMDFKPSLYHLIDLDLDGYNELMISGSPQSMEIFHFEEGVVYGYEFNYRATADVFTNGTLMNGSGQTWTYYRLDFNKDTYEEVPLYKVDRGVYTIFYEADSKEAASIGAEIGEDYVTAGFYGLGNMWTSSIDNILEIPDREKELETKAEEYVKEKEVPKEITDVLLHNAQFTDVSCDEKTTVEKFSKFEQKFEVTKYAIADLNEDGVNEVVAYFGGYIPLATIFTVEEKQVMAYTMLESEIWSISSDGVCYRLGTKDYEKVSYRMKFSNETIEKQELCKVFTIIENSTDYAYCEIIGKKASPEEFFDYYRQLWNEKVLFCKDLTALEE